MRLQKTFTLFLAFGLVVAACGDDDAPTVSGDAGVGSDDTQDETTDTDAADGLDAGPVLVDAVRRLAR